MTESPREIAVRVLRRRTDGREYVEKLLEQELAHAALSRVDRALCQELVYGTVRWEMTLDWLIARKTSPRPQAPTVQLLLRLGLYQIFWLQRIPNHAAVHETVELAKKLGCAANTGFLNAVLRGYAREREPVLAQLRALKDTDLAIGYSHPAWMVERWLARWGMEKTRLLLEWDNSPPPTFARLNELKTNAATLTAEWQAEGTAFAERRWDWTGDNLVYELQSPPNLAESASFQQGHYYIQDPSTLLAVHELNPQPGETILDLCAAPGGKTTYIAQRMQNSGRIIAHDNQPRRLERLRENSTRLGTTCVEPVSFLTQPRDLKASPQVGASRCDARSPAPTRDIPPSPPTAENNPSVIPSVFDRILVDAPCSNTGVLRRRVDLRSRVTIDEISRLRQHQLELLRQAATKLAPGGTLVYSTCSLEPEENESVTREFLTEHKNFALKTERQLLPFIDQVDGAYIATLRRAG